MTKLNQHPLYPAIKSFKKKYGRSILKTYQAHAIGIGWKEIPSGERIPSLIIYQTPLKKTGASPPSHFVFFFEENTDPVQIPIKVVLSDIAEEE